MKLQSLADTALVALAVGGASLLLTPSREAAGFTTNGGSLSAESQRDFRVHDNFSDLQSHSNTTPDAQFPGFYGAQMALWKAGVEWGSGPHGDGSGDPHQTTLGDGGANFDYVWAGTADAVGATNDNIISALSSCGGNGTLAFTETPISNGWRIRFCDRWTWFDRPHGSIPFANTFDIQGIGCHELGHALGLGHSPVPDATMISGTTPSASIDLRSIENDDIAGVQFIYGVKAAGKPVITGVSNNGSTLTITGTGFSLTGGQVWFTNASTTPASGDPLVKLTDVSSNSAGTEISVTIPAAAGVGDIAVKLSSSGHATLSNAFPSDGGGPPRIISVSPAVVENLIPGTAETILITGTGFTSTATIELDGNPIAGNFTRVSSSLLTFEWEPVSTLGLHVITVEDEAVSASAFITAVANALPTLQVGNGDPLNTVTGSASILVAGPPGQLNYLLVSESDAPSVLPGKINLSLGNSFQQLTAVGLFSIGANGITAWSVPLSGLVDTSLYWQGLRIVFPLASNYPLLKTNLQSTFTP